MSKIFIGIMTQNQAKNIDELTSVWKYFDGLAATDHFSTDGTYEILKSRAGDGFVEQIPYFGHHAHSLNHFLFNPKIKIGDWIVLRDSSERIHENVARQIRVIVNELESRNVFTVHQWSKVLMFKRFPRQFFTNTPHWGLHGAMSPAVDANQLLSGFGGEENHFYSIRNVGRDPRHFVGHYYKYYTMTDSNHCLLGIENRGPDINASFAEREKIRWSYLARLEELGIDKGKDGILDYICGCAAKNVSIDPIILNCFNKEKILNDLYREYILNDSSFKDDHDFNNLIKIEK